MRAIKGLTWHLKQAGLTAASYPFSAINRCQFAVYSEDKAKNKPTYLCIGAQKSGTTWLYSQLSQLPDVFVSSPKECHFFDKRIKHRTLGRYLKHFDTELAIKGEFTPNYFYLTDSQINLVKRLNKNTRIICLLRNPVTRAWSHAKMYFYRQNKSIESVAEGKILSFLGSNECTRHGQYTKNILRWYKHFDPDQVLLLPYELIGKNPHQLLQKVARHIGSKHIEFDNAHEIILPDISHSDHEVKVANRNPSRISEISPTILNFLIEQYANEIRMCNILIPDIAGLWENSHLRADETRQAKKNNHET